MKEQVNWIDVTNQVMLRRGILRRGNEQMITTTGFVCTHYRFKKQFIGKQAIIRVEMRVSNYGQP